MMSPVPTSVDEMTDESENPTTRELLDALSELLTRYESDALLLSRNGLENVDLIEWANHSKGLLEKTIQHLANVTLAVAALQLRAEGNPESE